MSKILKRTAPFIALFMIGCTQPSLEMEQDPANLPEIDQKEENMPMDHANMDHGNMADSGEKVMMDHGGMDHEHAVLELQQGDTFPTVDLVVHKDPMAGWNLQLKTTHFEFAPERASTDHVDGEGHAHLYIDGEKITRLYSEWYHVGSLSTGTHEVRVNLNANDHAAFTVNGEEIEDTETIVVE